MNDPAAAHAALTAFLRGVERRGAVFAEWQGGDGEAGDRVLAATLRGFREVAPGIAFADWPRRFWSMLLAAQELRATVRIAPDTAPAHVAALGSGPRAALLLRLVAGLAESEAAAVLGIARPTYRLALQRALPHRDDGSADPEAWRALSTAAQQAVRTLSPDRLARIAMLRDGIRPRPARPAAPPGTRAGWVWPATIAVLALMVALLAATWWGPWIPAPADAGDARIRTEELPPAERPAARFDPAAALETHRDLDLLIAQATGRFDDDADPAFEAWLVDALAQEGAPGAEPDAGTGAAAGTPQPEGSHAPD